MKTLDIKTFNEEIIRYLMEYNVVTSYDDGIIYEIETVEGDGSGNITMVNMKGRNTSQLTYLKIPYTDFMQGYRDRRYSLITSNVFRLSKYQESYLKYVRIHHTNLTYPQAAKLDRIIYFETYTRPSDASMIRRIQTEMRELRMYDNSITFKHFLKYSNEYEEYNPVHFPNN